jgi:hypothetical protein
MPDPGAQHRLRKQARRTLRTILDGAYPVELAPNADYDRGDFVELATLAIGRGTSLHDASQALRVEGNERLPHSDTFHRHLHAYRDGAAPILQGFETTLDQILDVARDLGWLKPSEVSIDRHNEDYWGEKEAWVMGQKRDHGTNWCHAYLTSKRMDAPGVTLDLQPVYPFRTRTQALKVLLENTERRQTVTTYYLDREFFNFEDLLLLQATGKDFVIPVPADRIPAGSIDQTWRDKKSVGTRYVATRSHTITRDDRIVNLVLVYHWQPDPTDESGYHQFVYATPRGGTLEQLDAWAARYRKRWDVETGYRLSEEVRLRTTTTVYANRLLLSCLAFLFDAYWRLIRYARGLREPEAAVLTGRAFRHWFTQEIPQPESA